MVNLAGQAADQMGRDGISCTVVDLRTTSRSTPRFILETARAETGRVVDGPSINPLQHGGRHRPDLPTGFDRLKAPIRMVTAPHCPVPFTPALEDLYIPSVAKIEAAGAPRSGRRPAGGLPGERGHQQHRPSCQMGPGDAGRRSLACPGAWPRARRSRRARRSPTSRPRRSRMPSSPVGGTLRRRLVDVGDTVPVGALLAVVADAAVADAADRGVRRRLPGPFRRRRDRGGGGPRARLRRAGGKRIRYLGQGRARGPGPVHPRLWRRSQQLAVQPAGAGWAPHHLCPRPAGHGGSTRRWARRRPRWPRRCST
ncbi:MAG: transketolase C-terminal domain-containing protein [Geminicoccaceae bacterium]